MTSDGEVSRPRDAKSHSQTSDPRPARLLRDHRLLASVFEKARLKFLYLYSAALYGLEYDHDDSDYQQGMEKPACRKRCNQTQQPQDQKDDGNGVNHDVESSLKFQFSRVRVRTAKLRVCTPDHLPDSKATRPGVRSGINTSPRCAQHRPMSRPLRIEFAGALHHVMARGDARAAIVLEGVDRQLWVDALGSHR